MQIKIHMTTQLYLPIRLIHLFLKVKSFKFQDAGLVYPLRVEVRGKICSLKNIILDAIVSWEY